MPFSALYVRSSILYVIRCRIGSQCNLRRTGDMCSDLEVFDTSLSEQFISRSILRSSIANEQKCVEQERVFVQNFSYENKFDLYENELQGETHFHKDGFALRLVLTQRQTRTRNWAIFLAI